MSKNDGEELSDIARFAESLKRREDESDSEQEFIGTVYSNRGRKLKRDAREVYQGKMNVAPFEGHGVKVVQYGDRKRAVVYKKRRIQYADEEEDDQAESDESGDEINPYDDIKLGDLLKPIGHPSEVVTHPAVNRAFTSDTLKSMATRAMEIINEEQKQVVQFAKLMSVFLGDDPLYALQHNMNLPAYDHLHDSTNDDPNLSDDPAASAAAAAENGNSDRRLTRNQVSQEIDPFFAPPQVTLDRDFRIDPTAAEETRQLTQIAQQRSEEFVRCMTQVRMGLLRADRYRDRVYKWCKEMNGEGEGMSEGGDNAETEDSEGE